MAKILILPFIGYIITKKTFVTVFANSINWRYQISESGVLGKRGLRRGNGVVVTKNGMQIWVTMDDGSLHILDAKNPQNDPKLITPRKYSGYLSESRSSVSLFESEIRVEFATYAVIYSPLSKDGQVRSQIYCVSNIGEVLWYTTIDGVAVGTPKIGNNGNLVYAIHNVKQRNTGLFTRGFLSVINSKNGQFQFSDSSDEYAPFGPPTLSYSHGVDNLYWGQAWDSGYRLHGRLYTYNQMDQKIVSMQKTGWSVDAAPLIAKDGNSMWIGSSKSILSGWINEHDFNRNPTFSLEVGNIPRNSKSPVPNRATVSSDESRLFLSSASTSFYCLNAANGRKIWSIEEDEIGSIYTNEAVLSPDETKVYSIRHNDGLVRQMDSRTGEILFQFSCQDLTQSSICHNSVEAEFSLSSDGNKLYYGDVFGNIISLKVLRTPTLAPTEQLTQKPTSPSLEPSIAAATQTSLIPSSSTSLSSTVVWNTSPPSHLSSNPFQSPTSKDTTIPSTLSTLLPSHLTSYDNNSSFILPAINSHPTLMPAVFPLLDGNISEGPIIHKSQVLSRIPNAIPVSYPPTTFIEKSPDVHSPVPSFTLNKSSKAPTTYTFEQTFIPTTSHSNLASEFPLLPSYRPSINSSVDSVLKDPSVGPTLFLDSDSVNFEAMGADIGENYTGLASVDETFIGSMDGRISDKNTIPHKAGLWALPASLFALSAMVLLKICLTYRSYRIMIFSARHDRLLPEDDDLSREL